MPFSPGARRLGQLVIDVIKDWGGKRITNTGAPSLDNDVARWADIGSYLLGVITAQGDILFRDSAGLQRLAPGTAGQFLQSQGPGADPVWASLTINVTEALTAASTTTLSNSWTTVRSYTVPSSAKRVQVWVSIDNANGTGWGDMQVKYKGSVVAGPISSPGSGHAGAQWSGDAAGGGLLEIQMRKSSGMTPQGWSGAWYESESG